MEHVTEDSCLCSVCRRKAYKREYRKRPEVREAHRLANLAYSARPEVAEKRKERARARRRGEYVGQRPAAMTAYDFKLQLMAALKQGPCMDCGVNYPYYVMDWDHRPGEEKLFNLSRGKQRTVEAIIAETKKCDLVCANCHRVRTAERNGWTQSPVDWRLEPLPHVALHPGELNV